MGRMRRKEKRKGENGRDKEKRMKRGGGGGRGAEKGRRRMVGGGKNWRGRIKERERHRMGMKEEVEEGGYSYSRPRWTLTSYILVTQGAEFREI